MRQAEALNILKTGANVFLTGSPGSGKTHTINAYVAWLRSHGIEPAITASTGIAATHIHGMTIHSWSGIGIRSSLSDADIDAITSKEHVMRRVQKTSVLILDEVSMLSGNLLSMLDRILREARRSQKPFGGVQLVLVGDFFQLPPIGKGEAASFAFQSDSWRAANPLICYLKEQHRQEDDAFLEVLTAIRESATDHTHISKILARETEDAGIADEVPRLFTHNVDVDRLNDEKLEALPGNPKSFSMSKTGGPVLTEALVRGCLSPEVLKLKTNALVMCTKNNPAAGYVNGTLGRVTGFENGSGFPIIETADGRSIVMQPNEWAIEEGGKIRAKITQVPLRLAWAITIHKSQGMSMDQAAMDLSRVFEYGQGYVALSRVRALSGLHLLGWSEEALKLHPQVAERDQEFQQFSGETVRAFAVLEENGERSEMEKRFIVAAGGSLEVREPGVLASKQTTYDQTLTLIKEGSGIAEIAKERSLTVGTVIDHVEKLAVAGRLSAPEVRGLTPASLENGIDEVVEAFSKSKSPSLTPIYKKLKGKYSFDELKFGRALAQFG